MSGYIKIGSLMDKTISNFFYPQSVCIAGASTKEKSIGYELLKCIVNYGYKGKIFPVNPKGGEVLGLKCYESVQSIDGGIDLAVIVVPKIFVEQTLDELLQKKVESIILITAGFREIGEEGAKLEDRILAKVRNGGARMTGPNCMGVISTNDDIKLNATFVAEKPEKGSMAFLSQSGALGAAVLNSLRESDIKFAHFVSVGNKADLTENDFISFWQSDDNIRTLTFYLESFENGLGFLTPFMKNHISKPVIVLKAGRTAAGMKAASSHTGALSAEDRIVESLLDQFGIIRAENLNEMFNTAKGFEHFPIPKGNRIAVVTNAGGPAILTVDALESNGLKLADLSKDTKTKLREIVHPEGSIHNPVDLLPGGNAETYSNVIENIFADDEVDAVISIFVEPVMVEPFGVVEAVNGIESDKPVLQVVMPLPEFWSKYRLESKYSKPLFRNPEEPAVVIANMISYHKTFARINKESNEYQDLLNTVPKSEEYNNGFINQKDTEELLERYDVPVCKSVLVAENELGELYGLDYPVVLKAVGKNIVHKSELGAVEVNLKNRDELFNAADRMRKSIQSAGIEIEQFHVQEFVESQHELLVGGYRDASFGPVIVFGSGGKYVEIVNDTAIKSAYASRSDLSDLINRTKIGKIFHGVRGEQAIDTNELVNLLGNCSRLLLENSNISEFDINPLIVTEDNLFKAVDVRIKIDNTMGGAK